MDRQLISLAVGILLVSVWPGTMADASYSIIEIEDAISASLPEGSGPHVPLPIPPGGLPPDSWCTAHGDVRYITLDGLAFGSPTPVHRFGVMVLEWTLMDWWVVTAQEVFGGATHTRVKEVYVKCHGEYFKAELGHIVVLSVLRWVGGVSVWSQIGGMAGPFGGGLVTVGFIAKRGFRIDCTGVPMIVDVYLHTVNIMLTPAHSAYAAGVRGICGNYDGIPINDWNMVGPPPPWGPFLL